MVRLCFLLILAAFSILIASCAESQINVEKGTFQAMKPPNIYGNGRYLEEGKHSTISFDANIGRNKTIPLPGLINKDKCLADKYICLQKTPANINYRLIENALGVQFYKTTIGLSPIYTGFGGGVQNFPYGFLMLGYNGNFIEFGGAVFWGLVRNKASYEGMRGYYKDVGPINPPTEFQGYVKFEDAYILHSYGGLVTHASFHWKKFALSYAASVSNPWLVDELPISTGYDADITFSFPALLMQDIGIS
jgi:hypothetical protein